MVTNKKPGSDNNQRHRPNQKNQRSKNRPRYNRGPNTTPNQTNKQTIFNSDSNVGDGGNHNQHSILR